MHTVALLALAVAAGLPTIATAQGRNDTVAIGGQSAPGAGAGTFFSFSFSNSPVLNDAGQTAFFASITGGSTTQGIYRSSGSALTAIALQGQAAPGAGAGTFSFLGSPILNNAGQTAFIAFITGGSSTQAIYRSSGSALTAIALQGQAAPGAGAGTFSLFGTTPVPNDAGQTAYFAGIAGGSSTGGIYRSSSGSALTAIALQGQAAPGAGAGTFSSLGDPVLNDAGQTAFLASVTGGSSARGIYRSSGGALTAIALQGQAAPGAGAGTLSFFDNPVLNDAGQTAFRADITGGSSARGIYRSSSGGSALTAIALLGQAAPGAGAGTFLFFANTPVLNDAGQTAFLADITGGSSTSGIYRSSSGSALTAIALQGQAAPGAGAGTFSFLGSPILNDAGQTAFFASITGGSSTNGAFIGDGREIVAAQLQGNSLAGKTVSSVNFGADSLNRFGQIAYRANFTDGTNGIFVFTPTLRWRESFSSSWDSASNWTLGIGPASVHDVTIDPSATLTVTGPAGAASVRSLTVGSGSGFATLALDGGTLGSASAVQIAGRGILTGSGTITAQVVNAGEVRADNLILSGGLVNNGTVRGAATGNQRIDANLTNNTAGRLRTDAGERLILVGTSHTNSGTVDINGGEMQFTGALTNNAGGRILLNDARVFFNSGLTNNGQMLVTFGESELFGSVTTNAGGKIILSGNSNTTFYDAVDIKSGGELRISTGSTAVFFGQVFQRTGSLFTGGGTKFYEGGLSVGGSPGEATDTGNVSFGAGNVYLAEIGGTTPGSEHDFLSVLGHLSFGGVLELQSWEGYVARAGDRFDLFDWGSRDGQFSAIDADGFQLADGTMLDTSRLYVDGSITVVAVPEPGTWVLMLAGLAGVVAIGRRRVARRA